MPDHQSLKTDAHQLVPYIETFVEPYRVDLDPWTKVGGVGPIFPCMTVAVRISRPSRRPSGGRPEHEGLCYVARLSPELSKTLQSATAKRPKAIPI